MIRRLLPATLLMLALGLGLAQAKDTDDYEVGPLPEWALQPPMSATPEELIAATKDLPFEKGDPVQVLLMEASWSYDAEGRATHRFRMVYRVLTRDPGGWARVTADWRPWAEERPELNARVVTPDGRSFTLDPRTISEITPDAGAGASASATPQLIAPLPGLGVGAVVELETTIREKEPAHLGVGAADYVFGLRDMRVAHERLSIDVPENTPLSFTSHNLDATFTDQRADGRREVSWVRDAGEATGAYEPLLPHDVNPLQSATWSLHEDWTPISRELDARVEAALEGADLAQLAKGMTKGLDSQAAKVEAITRLTRERVRPLDRAINEANFAPQTPAQTLERGTGDVLDHAVLLVGLLRAAGVPAEVALLIESGPEIMPTVPEPQRLSYALVYVPGEPATWIDPAEPCFAPNVLSWWHEGRPAVLARAEGAPLLTIPKSSAGDNVDRVEVVADVDRIGPAALEYYEVGTGREGAVERAGLASVGQEAWAESKQNWARSSLGATEDVTGDYLSTSPHDVPMELRLEVPRSDRVTFYGETVTSRLSSRALSELSGLLGELRAVDFDDDVREDDVLMRASRAEFLLTLNLPPGFEDSELPEPLLLEVGPLRFTRTFTRTSPNQIVVEDLFDSGHGRFTAKEAKDLLKQGDRVVSEAGRRGLRVRSEAGEAWHDDRVGDAVRAMRALTLTHPDDGRVAWRYADMLSDLRFNELARAEVERSISLLPDNRAAWVLYSELLAEGPLGDYAGPGWDLAASRDAARQAWAINPEDVTRASHVVETLLVNDVGHTLGLGVDLDPALELLAELKETLDEEDFREVYSVYCVALMRADQPAKALALDPDEEDSLLQAAVMAHRGDVDGAIELLQELPPGWRTDGSSTAARLALSARWYEAAAAIEAGMLVDDDAEDRRAWLPGTERWEDLKRPRSKEDAALRMLLPAVTSGGEPHKRLKASDTQRAALLSQLEDLAEELDVPYLAIADVVLSQAAVSGEGSWSSGRLITVDLSSLESKQPLYIAMTREGRRYVVQAADYEQLALAADRALQSGDRALAALYVGPQLLRVRERLPAFPQPVKKLYIDTIDLLAEDRWEEPGWTEAVVARMLKWHDLTPERVLALSEEALAAGLSDTEVYAMRWSASAQLGLDLVEPGQAYAEVLGDERLVRQIEVLAYSGLRAEAEARIAERWSNLAAPDARRSLAWVAEASGDAQGVVEHLGPLVSSYELEMMDSLSLAWSSLFLEELPEDAQKNLGRGRKEVGAPGFFFDPIQALLYLAEGEDAEAWELLEDELESYPSALEEYWVLVRGGLALSWGLTEQAELILGEVEGDRSALGSDDLVAWWLERGTPVLATPWKDEDEDEDEEPGDPPEELTVDQPPAD